MSVPRSCLSCCGEVAFARELQARLAGLPRALPDDVEARLVAFLGGLGPSSEGMPRRASLTSCFRTTAARSPGRPMPGYPPARAQRSPTDSTTRRTSPERRAPPSSGRSASAIPLVAGMQCSRVLLRPQQ